MFNYFFDCYALLFHLPLKKKKVNVKKSSLYQIFEFKNQNLKENQSL